MKQVTADERRNDETTAGTFTKQTRNTRFILPQKGNPTVYKMIEDALPVPGPTQVRVKVEASGVAFADVLARRGLYPTAPKKPFTPGYDLVGYVDAVGNEVTDLAPGQRVCGLMPHFGAHAAYAVADESIFVPISESLDAVKVVAMILNYLTAYRLLHETIGVEAGDRVLVHAAAGGVGTAVLQLGKVAGLEMYGTASRQKHEVVREQGATPIDYKNEAFDERVLALTGDGVDGVLDPIGGDTLRRSLAILRENGTVANYGFQSAVDKGFTAVLPSMMRILWSNLFPRGGRRARLYGDTPSLVTRKNAWYRQTLRRLLGRLERGEIDPVIGKTLPLAQLAVAHDLIENGKVHGKIVLVHP